MTNEATDQATDQAIQSAQGTEPQKGGSVPSDPSTSLLQEIDKEIFKNLIIAPQDGCKTMGTGTLTVIAVYIALLGSRFGKEFIPNDFWSVAGVLVPVGLFVVATQQFGRGYLPKKWIAETYTEGEMAKQRITDYERHIRHHLGCGLWAFWIGVVLALVFLIFYKQPSQY